MRLRRISLSRLEIVTAARCTRILSPMLSTKALLAWELTSEMTEEAPLCLASSDTSRLSLSCPVTGNGHIRMPDCRFFQNRIVEHRAVDNHRIIQLASQFARFLLIFFNNLTAQNRVVAFQFTRQIQGNLSAAENNNRSTTGFSMSKAWTALSIFSLTTRK